MKIYKQILRYTLIIGFMGIISCTDGFEELNKDPNAFNDGPVENVFAGVVKNTLDLIGGDLNDQMFLSYASYIGGKGGQFPHFYFTDNLDGYWRRFYVNILKNNQEIIDHYGGQPDYANRVHIAKIWKSYVYSVMVSTFGGVPMSDALGDEITAAYDTEEEIYTAILNMLKEAAEGIDPAGDKLSQDPIFNGDNGKWIKFANTLRLKIALRISEGFPAMAQEHGMAAMSNEAGLISSNAENVRMKWGTEEENWSYAYSRYIFGNPLPDVIPFMNFHFLLNLKTYEDPRMFVIADAGSEHLAIQDTLLASGSLVDSVVVGYGVPYYGKTLATDQPLDAWDLNGNDNPLQGVNSLSYSRPNAERYSSQDMDYNIVTFAELCFIKAEAQLLGWGGSKTAEQYYYDGIDASFDYFGASGAGAYKAQDGIAWGTESEGHKDLFSVVTSGISADAQDKIVRQRWIAMFYQGHDAWCLQKRTRKLPFLAHFAPDSSVEEEFVEIPERMVYPTVELGVNPDGYNAAVAVLGSDDLYTPLKMNKEYTPVDWEALPAAWCQEFAAKWYGETEDDLIAAGVDYTVLETITPAGE